MDQWSEPSASRPTGRGRYIVITTFGNVVEWFDFTVFGFLAIVMSRNFFPSNDPTISLLASFATFGVGFGARPVGAIIFGRMGDVRGRRFVLLVSISLMAVSSLMIGLAPTYATAGAWGAAVVVFARILQGFSAGGEFGNAIAYLIEWAPPQRRGLFGSFHQIGSAGGLLAGSTVVALLNAFLSPADIEQWGWRVPFLLGGMLATAAYFLRLTLPESPAFLATRDGAPPSSARDGVIKPTLQTIGIVALWTISVFASIVYMPTFTTQHGTLTGSQALWTTSIALMVLLVCIPIAGSASDRIGRRPIILMSAIFYALFSVPAFAAIANGATLATVAAIQIAFAIGSGLISGVGPVAIGELFAVRVRSTWTSIGSAIAVTLFGGFAPFISTLLIERTGVPSSPGWLVAAVAVLTGLTGLTLPSVVRRQQVASPLAPTGSPS